MNALIPDHLVDEIRDRADIVEVVSQHVHLTKRGRNYFGLCPFHTERTPSFSVNQEKQIFHCFGCGIGGNAFRFLMELDHISFPEAVRKLAQQVGVSLPEARVAAANASAHESLYRTCEFARDHFHAMLVRNQHGEPGLAYLEDRGVAQETIQRFKLGFAPPGWDHLMKAAARHSVSEELLEKAGLVVPKESGGHYDRFRDRLIFPIATASGRTVGFAGRALDAQTQPKYLNSPETPVYHKGSVLYGLSEAKDAIRKQGYAILVEGYMDALSLFQSGIEHVVATAGTALTEAHTALLSRHAPGVVLVFDADAAGQAAARRAVETLAVADLDAKVLPLPEGHDPDSFVREHGPDAFRRLVDSAVPMVDYLLEALAASMPLDNVEGKRRAILELARVLAGVPDPTRRGLLIDHVADELGVRREVVLEAVSGSASRPRHRATPDGMASDHERIDAPLGAERDLLRLMLRRPNVVKEVRDRFVLADFTHEPYRRIAEVLLSVSQEGRVAEPALVMDRCDQSLAPLVSELATDIPISPQHDNLDREEMFAKSEEEVLRKMRWEILDRKQQAAEAKLRKAQEAKDEAAAAELLAECHRLNMEKRALGEIQKNA